MASCTPHPMKTYIPKPLPGTLSTVISEMLEGRFPLLQVSRNLHLFHKLQEFQMTEE